MKLLFITKANIFDKAYSGGVQASTRNYGLLKNIFGEKSYYTCIISDEKAIKQSDHIKYIYYKNSLIQKYVNYLALRNGFGRKVEKDIISFIQQVKADIIFFDGSDFGGILNKTQVNSKIIVFYHNIEKEYAWDRVLHNNPLCIFRFLANWYNEKIITKKADVRICLNLRDNNALEKNYGKKCDFLLPITFSDSFETDNLSCISETEAPYLLFVGSNFLPNYKGIKWFVENVMDYIDIQLKIVGKNMEQYQKELSRDNVQVIGTVDNLLPDYKNAQAMVMPIFMGAGMKVKTAEALMYGKTIFGTQEAFEGYDIDGTANLNVCNSTEEFINSIKNYLNLENRRIFNPEIRELFLSKYETSSVEKSFGSLIKGLLNHETDNFS